MQIEDITTECEIIVLAVPSGIILGVVDQIIPYLRPSHLLIDLAKGLAPEEEGGSGIISKAITKRLEDAKNLPDIAVYLPIAAGQSLGLGNILRAGVHPILNQDDLPTWDRLTMKNPLYVMFLDDLAHKAKAATGTILGQDFLGTPVYVPTP